MPEIVFDNLVKKYGDASVIDNVSAVVPDKEFLVLVGPSGCGKSTLLRMIAGLADISSGSVRFDGKPMENVAPKARDIAFVFQSYALYPHLTVRANIAFPLVMAQFRWWYHIPVLAGIVRRRMMNSSAIKTKVEKVAEMLKLTPYLERRPASLSGGQRQRVAVARSLVREPSVYLLDEPLSNLDAALRTQMRAEIMALHRAVQKNFIFVTHDQVEAMTMGTRIIVLDRGVVQQYATPTEIYERPANVFVARFIGVPPMNILTPREVTADAFVLAGGARLPIPVADRPGLVRNGDVLVGVRPEMITVSRADDGTELDGTVISVEYLGAESIVSFRLGTTGAALDAIVQDEDSALHARVNHRDLAPGDVCAVRIDLSKASYFSRSSGNRIETRESPANSPASAAGPALGVGETEKI